MRTNKNIPHERELDRQHLIWLKESLIDLDTAVDDARQDVNSAVANLRAMVARRNDIAAQLAAVVRQAAA